MTQHVQNKMAFLMRMASWASVAVASTLIVIKMAAFSVTDSVAMFSSLIDSSLDAAASLLSFFAIRHSLAPPDQKHRFGHGKIEALGSLGQAAFIAGSSALLFFQSIQYLLRPRAVENPDLGIGAMLVSIVLTLGLVLFQKYVIKKTGSMAITADSAHYAGDILLNVSVLLSLFVGSRYQLVYLDPILALLIALYLLWSAWGIFQGSLSQLTDSELPEEQKQKIIEIVKKDKDVKGIHDLRTRVSGIQWFIQIHLELDPELSLRQAHTIADRVEKSLLEIFPNSEILIHQDPAGLKEEPPEWEKSAEKSLT